MKNVNQTAENNTILQGVLECKDLSVILKDRYGRSGRERHALSNILYKDGKFWAKHSMAYAPDALGDMNKGQGSVNQKEGHGQQHQALSQSFSNFCDMDCISNLCAQSMQLITSKTYSEKAFVTHGQFRKVWSLQEGGDITVLRDCVAQGIKLKVLVQDHDQYVYVTPMHLMEVYLERDGFISYSDYDGYPEILKDFHQNKQQGEALNTAMGLRKEKSKEGQYARSTIIENTNYFLTMFVMSDKALFKRRINKDGDISQHSFPCVRAEIWAECNDRGS